MTRTEVDTKIDYPAIFFGFEKIVRFSDLPEDEVSYVNTFVENGYCKKGNSPLPVESLALTQEVA